MAPLAAQEQPDDGRSATQAVSIAPVDDAGDADRGLLLVDSVDHSVGAPARCGSDDEAVAI